MRRRLVLLATLIAVAAQAQQAEKLRIGAAYLGRYPEIDIVLESTPPAGQAETLFRASDLVLVEDGTAGKPAAGLRQFREIGKGIALVVAIDASGSMRGGPIDAVRKGLAQSVADAREFDRISLITFANDGHWEANWTTPRDQLKDRLQSIQPRGTITRLWDAVDASITRLAERGERRRLLVISDGHDEGSQKTLAAVTSRARSLRIPVDCIGLTRGARLYLHTLKALSAATGGNFRIAVDDESLRQMVGGGVRRILDGPVGRFQFSRIKRDGKSHRIAVTWKSVDQGNDVMVEVPRRTPSWLPVWFETWHWVALAGLLVGLGVLIWKKRKPAPAPYNPPLINQMPAGLRDQKLMDDIAKQAGQPWPNPIGRPEPQPQTQPQLHRARTEFAAVFSEPKPGRPAGVLHAKEGPMAGQEIAIDRGEFWIGAAEGNHLRVEMDDAISSHHASVRLEGSTLKIYDNESTNNTWVNGEAVGGTARLLYPGDSIRVGRSVFILTTGTDQ